MAKLNYIKSEAETILFGVPQGIVLRSLLFLLYINDIIHSTNQGEFVILAEDTNIFKAAKNKAQAYKTDTAVLFRSVDIYICIIRNACRVLELQDMTKALPLTLSINGQKVKKLIKSNS